MTAIAETEVNDFIGSFYDCAVDPENWVPTLSRLRDRLGMACVHLCFTEGAYAKVGEPSNYVSFRTTWPDEWVGNLHQRMGAIPGVQVWAKSGIDECMSQLQAISEDELRRTAFYSEWLRPQGLRDYSCTVVAKREKTVGTLVAATPVSGEIVTREDRRVFRTLAPHVRRALQISGMLDEGRLQVQLYRGILDRVSAGIAIVGEDQRLIYANAQAEDMLSAGDTITSRQGRLAPSSNAQRTGFEEALRRACSGSDADLGTYGNGIGLVGRDGAASVAYVLPLARSERRREVGTGMAAVFLTANAGSIPPALETLAALAGLTAQEARVALLVAEGSTPAEIGDLLDVSIATVRTHLARAYDKTGTGTQQALARFVRDLSLPFTARPETGPRLAHHSLG